MIMLNKCILLPQYKNSLSKAQLLFSVAAYFQKIVDIFSVAAYFQKIVDTDKRAYFSFRQQHNHFFSSIFADGTSGVSVFTFAQKRHFAALGIFCALGMQRSCSGKVIINIAFYRRSRPAIWFDSG
ncbi:hypothetical protein C5N99_06605 [Treponema medium]|nr:hypothetical protein C5N99_06605 [Treponema medium]